MTAMRARFQLPARTTVARHDGGSACRFWRGCASVRVSCPSCVSSSLVHAAPWLAGPREAEGASGPAKTSLDLSKEHLRTQELESCAPVADTFGLSFLRGGVRGGGVRPLSRHHVGNRACVAARPGKKTPPANPLTCWGDWLGVSQVVDGNAGTVSSFQHGQQSQDMTGSACRFWRGLCVRAGFLPVVCLKFFGPRRPLARRPRVKPKAQAGRRA